MILSTTQISGCGGSEEVVSRKVGVKLPTRDLNIGARALRRCINDTLIATTYEAISNKISMLRMMAVQQYKQ